MKILLKGTTQPSRLVVCNDVFSVSCRYLTGLMSFNAYFRTDAQYVRYLVPRTLWNKGV
jgi:hypothetical protein